MTNRPSVVGDGDARDLCLDVTSGDGRARDRCLLRIDDGAANLARQSLGKARSLPQPQRPTASAGRSRNNEVNSSQLLLAFSSRISGVVMRARRHGGFGQRTVAGWSARRPELSRQCLSRCVCRLSTDIRSLSCGVVRRRVCASAGKRHNKAHWSARTLRTT